MKIYIISFTQNGAQLASKLKTRLTDCEITLFGKEQSLSEICQKAFDERTALLFIGAMGIAVRSIAPYVKDKLHDSAVVVMDELGRYVIPVLSGHMGGANEMALKIADISGAEPVITTATDINHVFSADLFARENGLRIINREGIAKVSSRALEGKPVTISIKNYPPASPADVVIFDEPDLHTEQGKTLLSTSQLVLCPKRFALGMGCRKGKSFKELRNFALRVLEENEIEREDIGCIATIDLKEREEGLRTLAHTWSIPLVTFDAVLLSKVSGDFSFSEKVFEKAGVGNVCERAAVLAAGAGSKLRVKKCVDQGMTAAVSERKI